MALVPMQDDNAVFSSNVCVQLIEDNTKYIVETVRRQCFLLESYNSDCLEEILEGVVQTKRLRGVFASGVATVWVPTIFRSQRRARGKSRASGLWGVCQKGDSTPLGRVENFVRRSRLSSRHVSQSHVGTFAGLYVSPRTSTIRT